MMKMIMSISTPAKVYLYRLSMIIYSEHRISAERSIQNKKSLTCW